MVQNMSREKEDLFLIQSETMNYIKEYMIIKNISNEKLAKMLKLNRDTISKWINNRVFISDKKIENLVNVLCFNNVKELKDFVDEYKEKHNGKLVIVPEEANVVRIIFNEYSK